MKRFLKHLSSRAEDGLIKIPSNPEQKSYFTTLLDGFKGLGVSVLARGTPQTDGHTQTHTHIHVFGDFPFISVGITLISTMTPSPNINQK